MPNDPPKATITFDVSLGSPACTTRGFGEKEFIDIGNKIVENINELAEEAKLGGDN